jgi:hypothetical protein
MLKRVTSKGYSAIEAIIVLVVVTVIGLGGWWVWRHNHQPKKMPMASNSSTSQTGKQQQSSNTQPADPYAGWKTSCDAVLKACYKYPNDWVQAQYGGWQNTANTAYFNFAATNKDQATNNVYIAAIEDLANKNQNLKIVGTIDDNVPGYTVYDASVITDKHVAIGQFAQLITVNPTFNKDITFVATPGASGIAAITSPAQAKAWFSTPEAQQCLKILQSFYYQ